ncbi:hypothetical protein GJAV_G00120160 [Gymnothorax javanicus]|nr:hypothetical protein GJAV_G00120160 [Gymnothorax javanicus]
MKSAPFPTAAVIARTSWLLGKLAVVLTEALGRHDLTSPQAPQRLETNSEQAERADTMWLWGFGALCLTALPGLLLGEPIFVEGDRDSSRICKPPPRWSIGDEVPMERLLGKASRLGGLRDKLARGGLKDVGFIVVNEREAQSRAMFWELKRRVAEGIPVYQQAPLQDDVWEALQGDKDDFLVYDRCGRLTFHIVLPYSFLHYPFIEAAIRATYLKDICGNCSMDSNATLYTQLNNTQSKDTGHIASNANKTDSGVSKEPVLPAIPVQDVSGGASKIHLPEGGAAHNSHNHKHEGGHEGHQHGHHRDHVHHKPSPDLGHDHDSH